jgi:hypothetical protein
VYEKIVDFDYYDIQPKYSYAEVRVDDKDMDTFIFGGCAARIVANLHVTRSFV